MAYGIFFDPQPAATYHTVPPPFNAGASGQGSCSIVGCHSGSVNTGGGSTAIIFNGTDNNYESGKTYDMSLLISDATASRYGFQMVAFDETDKSAGDFIAANSNTTTQTTASVQFINHNNVPNPSPSSFNFQWTARVLIKVWLLFMPPPMQPMATALLPATKYTPLRFLLIPNKQWALSSCWCRPPYSLIPSAMC
ncbi:MAG: hypothetical protein IPL35_16040 [Sphingobacteriales bacterium]|nr:hypothetical protein [Sphingobacteriales bacterium]